MDKFLINGGNRLYGKINIGGAKNSALPLIAASILIGGKVRINGCPKIYDVFVLMKIIKSLGGKAEFKGGDLLLDTGNLDKFELPCDLTREVRASLFTVGALLSRFKNAIICAPGGCNIGDRPIDIHIEALKKLGVKIYEEEIIYFRAEKIKGAELYLKFPSVGATENIIMASVFAEGTTVIKNAAKEPEINDLQNFLNSAGARISGAGTSEIIIEGVKGPLKSGIEITPVSDRIETGTFLLILAVCGGEIEFGNADFTTNAALLEIFQNNACKTHVINGKIKTVESLGISGGFGAVGTNPYPGFPTDLQPQLTAAACFSDGKTEISESVFNNRFGFAEELKKFGADISVSGNKALVTGRKGLHGAVVYAGDLRGGAALALAGLGAEGSTEIKNVYHIDRGYENFELKLKSLGADIRRKGD